MNLTFSPLGEARRTIAQAYAGPGCRFHPAPFETHEVWAGDPDAYYDCCWAFDEAMPGCQVAPHEA